MTTYAFDSAASIVCTYCHDGLWDLATIDTTSRYMRFIETPLNGAWVIDLDLLGDERGWFARAFDALQ